MRKKLFTQVLQSAGFSFLLAGVLSGCAGNVEPPAPYGALPSAKQIDWHQLEYYMFMHFGPNTFTDVEWGDGKEDPKVFNPSNLDARQWASTAKAAGMKGIIITAKHHDGFCLWPSNYSTHTVRESAWKDGKGDVLRELSDACKEYGLLFGVYLSPWDQNHPSYGTPEYNEVFANTLTEVLTQYGDVFEQWFDGANGDAHKGKRQVYDWDLFHNTVYTHQPQALIFSDIGPDCRWMGNERGIAGKTNWATLNIKGFEPGLGAPSSDILNTGNRDGEKWVPAEVDVSIRPGWFYSPTTDNRVKSVEHLMDIYYTSIGRNSNLLLNVPPTREGRIHKNDSTRLMEFKQVIEESFANDLMKNAKLKATNTRGNSSRYGVKNLIDGAFDTYWATDDEVKEVSIEIELPKMQSFNRFQVQEYIPLGQRIAAFTVDVWNEETGSWQEIASETTVGYKRIVRFPLVTAQKLRLHVKDALACPALNGIGLFKAVEFISTPQISRDKEGRVTIACPTPDPVIYYTTDGTTPTVSSIRYDKPFALLRGGMIKAVAMIDNNQQQSEVVTADYDIAPAKWSIVSHKNEEVAKAIDGNTANRVLIDKGQPLTIDLGETLDLKGFVYTPVNHTAAPNIYRYTFSVSEDNKQWQTLQRAATFNNIRNNPIAQEVLFETPAKARYIKLEALELANPAAQYAVSEVSVLTVK
ncbi:alpha-L-fucosidase [Parabacteroides sp. PF5-6]|uniref:alpha-L-fucosidase n=1 Tax=Parabacteroides sp. PF5-6 TaxID=1742403 RepID=UPI002406AE4A|nr:alpha-L-fucosidase [Parabacteroides sp. PF5-6]MDF9829705.1 alpha-L-fucosidase [Parabacteroides sp. PF5-6]